MQQPYMVNLDSEKTSQLRNKDKKNTKNGEGKEEACKQAALGKKRLLLSPDFALWTLETVEKSFLKLFFFFESLCYICISKTTMEPKKFSSFQRNPKAGFLDSAAAVVPPVKEYVHLSIEETRPDSRTSPSGEGESNASYPTTQDPCNPAAPDIPEEDLHAPIQETQPDPRCLISEEAWHTDTAPINAQGRV
ncbi:unnamed protein product [Ranitomeya imitator]|uniref:Uncharacterized protein n=1 Tax=Ranitomeya imitator TaxID=111125 RepID=A0ABN9KUX8_9NEOB|nr:unnamed protein product [Ranitomeya imitator]